MKSAQLNETFDVIIAGAGASGCVLASRLSEQSSAKVLLLEAGPDAAAPGSEHPDVLDPFCQMASSNPAFHWPRLMVEMSSQPALGTAGVRVPYIQGFGVGGASNINGMGVDRGQPGDYDQWGDDGAKGWGWADVLPYFRKLEHDLDFSGPASSAMHGDSGPMPVRRLSRSRWAPFTATIGHALERRGFDFIKDYTADFREGFSAVPTNCLADRRMSASMAYLTRQVRRRANLRIVPHARVDRVSLNGKRADGVFVSLNGETLLVRARQVIISCGAIQSPTLLMRSGIGKAQDLVGLGIKAVQHLPGVGANLQNHPCLLLTTYLSPEAAQPPDNLWFLQNWMRYSSHQPGCDPCDMHLMAFNKCAWHALGRRVGAVVVTVLQSFSKGRVELASADPAVAPKVQFNLLGDLRDRERLARGLRFVLELLTDPMVAGTRREVFLPNDRLIASLSQRSTWNGLKAKAMALILDRPALRRLLLGSSRIDATTLLADERALQNFVSAHGQLQYHICGTCRMGAADDPDSVVDSVGEVHGMEALHVVDASIFPSVPRGYTHFIVLMAAEKIADAIKACWR